MCIRDRHRATKSMNKHVLQINQTTCYVREIVYMNISYMKLQNIKIKGRQIIKRICVLPYENVSLVTT